MLNTKGIEMSEIGGSEGGNRVVTVGISATGNRHDAADRYFAASYAAGRALVASMLRLGVDEAGVRFRKGEYVGYCYIRRQDRPRAKLEYILAGEVARVVLGLCGFTKIRRWNHWQMRGSHMEAVTHIELWESYWGRDYPTRWNYDNEDYSEQECAALIDLTRYQVRRRLMDPPARRALEALALRLRAARTLSGQEINAIIRANYRTP